MHTETTPRSETVPESTKPEAHKSDRWENLGASLRRGMANLGTEVTLVALGLTLAGCSPQTKSYYSGSFTDLPPPPPDARLQLSVSTEQDGTVFINYVTWDQKSTSFVRKDIHYTSEKMLQLANYGDFREAGGYKQTIRDGEVLMGGAIVDQAAHKILLPNGTAVDGPSGNIVNTAGQVLKAFGGAK
jgi:hypothetical protein